jgi:hypothetical protein
MSLLLGFISIVVSTWSENEVLQNIHNLVLIEQSTLLSHLQPSLYPTVSSQLLQLYSGEAKQSNFSVPFM